MASGDTTKLMEDKIRKMLVPDLELDLLDVTALEWEKLPLSEKQAAESKSDNLLQSTIHKILEVEQQQEVSLEKERKNAFRYRCKECGNNDQGRFVEIEGSMICKGVEGTRGCGFEVLNYKPHEGNFYRSFAGEEDRSHHGKAFNPLFSEGWNSRTEIALDGVDAKSGAKIKAAMTKIEDELSNVNRDADDRRTRDSYRDKHKSKSFRLMENVVSNLSLHSSVMERAQYLFAIFRDDRDRVQRDKLVIAACLIIGFREKTLFSEEGGLAAASGSGGGGGSEVGGGINPEQAKLFKAEQKRMYQDVISGYEQRKRAKDEIVEKMKEVAASAGEGGTSDSASGFKPMKTWQENEIESWLFSVILNEERFTPSNIQSCWGKTYTAAQISMVLSQIKPETFVPKIIAKLKKLNKPSHTLGQTLLLCNARLFNVCECGKGSTNCLCEDIASQLFKVLKAQKSVDFAHLESLKKNKKE